MKIGSFNNPNLMKIYAEQNKKAKLSSLNDQASQDSDRVEISSKAKEMFELKQKYQGIPDVNSARIEEIKAKIAGGEYNIPAAEIAKKMLDKFSIG